MLAGNTFSFVVDLDPPTINKKNNTHKSTLTCISKGHQTPSFRWMYLGKVVSNTAVLNIKLGNDSDISSYICVVKNEIAELTTSLITNSHCK